jgi:MFS superfamily sulfate permease-like transporter
MTELLAGPEPGAARVPHAPLQTGWMRWVPGLQTLRRYDASWLRHDIVAGLVMTTMLVPVGIAYAEASGLPGIAGLYATIVPLLAYALFGPSRILVLGPDSALAAVILSVVLPLSGGDPQRALAVGGMMALVSGAVCIAAGLARLGFITELLSKPIRYGYMNGIALTVILSQLPKLLGFKISAEGPLRQAWAIVKAVGAGNTNAAAGAIGGSALALILVLKRRPRIPGMLVAVAAATLVVGLFDLAARTGISVLGPLPQGLPLPRLPLVSADSIVAIVTGGVAVALVSFADTSVLSRTYAARLRTPVDPNQEMVGLGAANVAAGLFQGFPISSSSSRTPVAEAAGARTQLTGVVGAAAIAVLLVLAPALLQDLPNTALAAIVIASAIGLFEVSDLRRIYRIQRWEFWLSMTCFAGVAVFGAIPGIVLAIVIRWDAPLFFANAEFFHDRVLAAIASSPTPVSWLVVAAEPVTSVDVTSADALCELDDTLRAAGIEMCFAEMKDPVKEKLTRFGLMTRFGRRPIFATIEEAVGAYYATAAK